MPGDPDKGLTWLIDNGEPVHKGVCQAGDEEAHIDVDGEIKY